MLYEEVGFEISFRLSSDFDQLKLSIQLNLCRGELPDPPGFAPIPLQDAPGSKPAPAAPTATPAPKPSAAPQPAQQTVSTFFKVHALVLGGTWVPKFLSLSL